MLHVSKPILILKDGGVEYTTGNRARRFVRDGRAEWADAKQSKIRFCTQHHAHKSVQAQAESKAEKATRGGYDDASGSEFSNLTKLRRGCAEVPMIGDATRLLVRLTKRGPGLIGARI